MSELEKELRRAGDKVAEGRFRIDARRALERLKHHRFAEPSHWVLEVVRAAVLSRARRIDVRTDADDVEVSFDGQPFPAEVMKDLLAQGLVTGTTRETRRARLLGLGVVGALGVSPERLVVESGGVRVSVSPDAEVMVEPGVVDGTRLALRKRFGWRVAAAVLRGAPEAVAVRQRCGGVPAELVLNGTRIEAKPRADERQHRLDGGELLVSPAQRGDELTEVLVELLGVTLVRRVALLPGVQLRAVLKADELRTNASGSDVVDDDPVLAAALAELERASLQGLEREVQRFRVEPDDDVREAFVARLLNDDTPAHARAILEQAPVLPGPAGERYSVAEVRAAVTAGRPLHVASSLYPEGTYPKPTILHPQAWKALLPTAHFVDVAPLVQRNRRAAETKKAWAAQPLEPAVVGADEAVYGRLSFDTPTLEGQVALHDRPYGAFVRVLNAGRFVQQGEVNFLAPLRLRAVVNIKRELPPNRWQEVPSHKLFSQVTDDVLAAAKDAVLAVLGAEGGAGRVLRPETRAHARDLLLRLLRDGAESFPAELRRAPLFPVVGGGPALSLEQLEALRPWRYVTEPFSEPLLNGEPVLQVSLDDVALLKQLHGERLQDATSRLVSERAVRRRLASGEKEKPRLPACEVVVPLRGNGLTGEVGLVSASGKQRSIELLRDGFRLETAQVPSALPQACAIVDAPALTPDDEWLHAVRDDVFERVVQAVRDREGALAAAVVRKYLAWRDLPPWGKEYLARWGRDALTTEPADTLEGQAVEGLLFDTSVGPRTLSQLRDAVKARGRLWVLGDGVLGVPASLLVVAADDRAAPLLARVTGLPAEDASPEVVRARAEEAFRARPLHPGRLPDEARPRGLAEVEGVRLEAGLSGTSRSCAVEVLVEGRLLLTETLPARLPLQAVAHVRGLSPAVRFLAPEWRERLGRALDEASRRLLAEALSSPDAPGHRRALLQALAVRFDVTTDEALGQRLRDWPAFLCTDGRRRAVAELEGRDVVCFTDSGEGELPDGTPVVFVHDDDERQALARFRAVKSVTEELALAAAARAERARLKARDAVRVEADSPWRRAFRTGAMEGEVAVLPRDGGWLELLMEKKPLCVLQGALSEPLAASVNCDALKPVPSHSGVVHDAAFEDVLEQVQHAALALAEDVAASWPSLPDERRAAMRAPVVALAFWVARVTKRHALLDAAVLESTDGGPMALAALLAAPEKGRARKKRKVPYAERAGRLLDDARVVWRPRPGELELAKGLGVPLEDVSPQLQHAEAVRARPKKVEARAPLASRWRQVVAGRTTHGEVALPEAPTRRLEVHFLHEMAPLETYVVEHPVGGVAEVNCDALRANGDWTKVVRNQAFRDALAQVESALETLVARRLADVPDKQAWAAWQAWLAWATAALEWRREVGPLASCVPGLALFERLDGAPVSVGEVLAEYSRSRRVAVAASGAAPAGTLVLNADPLTRQLLAVLSVEAEDVTPVLERKAALEAHRRARRIEKLQWVGDALLRLNVDAPGLRGQLALPLDDDEAEVRLAREGVMVGPAEVGGPPGLAGVLDVDGLEVDETWTRAHPTPAQVTAIRQAMEGVYAELARRAGEVPTQHRGVLLQSVLGYFRHAGVRSPAHLDGLTGSAAALSRAPLFSTMDGRRVSLRAVADEVLARGSVAVMGARLFRPDVGKALVLEAPTLTARWVDALAKLWGDAAVERVEDVDAWRARQAEADPPKDTPEWRGLERLRREVRLLRAGALGRLTPSELEDVRLVRAGGKTPLRYDRKRRLVLLDPDDEGVRRALVEYRARPERLFALVAAVYGAVNRALDHVTDAHEAELLLALAGHLAANPKLLEPRGDAQDE